MAAVGAGTDGIRRKAEEATGLAGIAAAAMTIGRRNGIHQPSRRNLHKEVNRPRTCSRQTVEVSMGAAEEEAAAAFRPRRAP